MSRLVCMSLDPLSCVLQFNPALRSMGPFRLKISYQILIIDDRCIDRAITSTGHTHPVKRILRSVAASL